MQMIADNLWTFIPGNFPKGIVEKATSYKQEGYWFSSAYKSGFWNGSISFLKYNRSKKIYYFPTGLLDRVVKVLQEHEVNYNLQDNRILPFAEPIYDLHHDILGTMRLTEGKYSYQAEVLDRALAKTRGVIKIATGGGKTEIGAALINSIGGTSVWLTHRRNLMYQTKRRLEERLQTQVGIFGDGDVLVKDCTVAMVQSLDLKSQEIMSWLSQVNLVIGDEVHHLEASQWYEQFSKIPAPWRFGLTATPKLDGPGLALIGMTGDLIVDVKASQLIERGVLVRPRIWFYPIHEPVLIDAKLKYADVYKKGIVENQKRNLAIVEVAKVLKHEGKATITLVKRIAHGEYLTDLLCKSGVRADFIRGSVSQEQRDTILRKLWEGKLDHIVAIVEIMGEGADLPFLRAVINATGTRGGGSPEDGALGRQTIQILGRGLRAFPGKTYFDYIDMADRTHKWLTEASLDRVQTLDSEGYSAFVKYWKDYRIDVD